MNISNKLRKWVKGLLGMDIINYIKSTTPGSNGHIIYLDGVEQALGIEANAKEGWIIRYIKVTNLFEEVVYGGIFKVDKNGKPISEKVYGKVEIKKMGD